MRIGILCAGDDEAAPFLDAMQKSVCTEKAMLRFYCGTLDGADAAVLYSGAGKVNAAIAAQILIDRFGCGFVINAGCAGALSDRVALFDTVIVEKAAYHDADKDLLTEFHPWLPSVWLPSDETLLARAREAAKEFPYRTVFGAAVTGDCFIAGGMRAQIEKAFAPLCADMETAAAAHVCHVNCVPFIAVRTITDAADENGKQNFEQNSKKASAIAAEFARLLIKKTVRR